MREFVPNKTIAYTEDMKKTLKKVYKLKEAVKKFVFGQDEMIDKILVALLCNEHVLIEGLPGTAKTTTVKLISAGFEDLDCKRIQFTPDLQPTDLIGGKTIDTSDPERYKFILQKGKIYCNVLIADEINRAPSKVQSALLEVMQERRITRIEPEIADERKFWTIINDEGIPEEIITEDRLDALSKNELNQLIQSLNIDEDKSTTKIIEILKKRIKERFTIPNADGVFCVFATQNPIEQEGVFPLAEAALDRFLFKILVDYPKEEDTLKIIRKKYVNEEYEIKKILVKDGDLLSIKELIKMQKAVENIELTEELGIYINKIIRATYKPRNENELMKELKTSSIYRFIKTGASPRAFIHVAKAAKAHAFLNSKESVDIDDINAVIKNVLRHRIKLTFEAVNKGITTDHIIEEIMDKIKY